MPFRRLCRSLLTDGVPGVARDLAADQRDVAEIFDIEDIEIDSASLAVCVSSTRTATTAGALSAVVRQPVDVARNRLTDSLIASR